MTTSEDKKTEGLPGSHFLRLGNRQTTELFSQCSFEVYLKKLR